MPIMQEVDSAMFSHVGYDEQNGEMHGTFRKSGDTWRYPMSQDQFEAMMAAPSMGQWFHANVNRKNGKRV